MEQNYAGHEGLELLHLSSKELAQLEAMGIATLEQLALSSRYDLGMGKSKGDALVTRTHNVLATKHARSVSIEEDVLRLTEPRGVSLLLLRE